MPRNRRRSSWGSAVEVRRGVWRLRWWQDGKRCSETVEGTRRQADRRLAELRVAVGESSGGTMTLRAAYEKWWLPDARDRVADGSYAKNSLKTAQSLWSVHVEPRWGSVAVGQIRPQAVQEWLLTLTSQTAAKSRSLMRQVLDFCVLYEALGTNQLEKRYRMPKADATVKDMDKGIYSLEELGAVARAVRGLPIEGAVLLAAFGSARVGESLGLMANEVRLTESMGLPVAVAPVVRQVDNRTGEPTEALKTPQSRRPLVVPGPLGVRLARVAEEAAARGDVWLVDDGLGRPYRQRVYNLAFDRAMKAAGVPRHSPGRLRNSWQTYMHWDLGVPSEVIEKLMGHKGKTITEQHYDLPDEERLAQAVARAYLARPFADSWGI